MLTTRTVLLALALGMFSCAVVPQGITAEENAGKKSAKIGATADLSTAPRVGVDRPKPTFMLMERDKRVHGLKPFQALIDAAPAGSVLRPPPGNYAGPVTLSKALTIEGDGKVTIDSGDRGTVFTLQSNGATLRGLHLTGSGDNHDTDDSCLDVRGHHNVIESLVIDNCLFGIDLKQSNSNVLRGNRIKSKPVELGVRGDGIRLWYSNDNLLESNLVIDSRDMVAWYSNQNIFRGNEGRRSRYSIHFMFANDNLVEKNRFIDNAVGVYFMYSESCIARDNVLSHASGSTGMALGFKEASDIIIQNNDVIYNGVGIGIDISPFQPGSTLLFENNRFAYNGVAVQLSSELGGILFKDNVFEGNINDITQGGRGLGDRNKWLGNYFDTYEGFDTNKDGHGDTPHEAFAYADQIWIEIPAASFFKASPVLELLNFLEKLAPFTSPERQLKDPTPRYMKPRRGNA